MQSPTSDPVSHVHPRRLKPTSLRFHAFKWWIPTALVAGLLLVMVRREMRAHRTPLAVGALPDTAWTYIHTPAANTTRGPILCITRGNWQAHARDIQCDAKYYVHWRKDRLFATRHIIYSLGPDGRITGSKSGWQFVRPF